MDLFLKRFTTHNKLNSDLQLRFLQLLHRLLSNGYSLLEALETIKWNKELHQTAELITESFRDGMSVDEAFEKAAFHPSITSYLYFVRGNGDLEGTISKCAAMYEHRMKYIKKFQQVSRYPFILFFIFFLLMYFIKWSVLPSFQDLFRTSSEASFTIFVSILVIDILGSVLFILLIVTLIAIIIWNVTKKRLPIEKQLKVYESIPIYRSILKLQTSFHFAAHFGSLLKTGMSFREILQHMSKQTRLPIIAYYSQQMNTELSKGLHIASLLSVFTFLENQLTAIFHKNVDVHALEKDLNIYSELLMEEIQRKITKNITLIQPVFFLILACFVIFIYITLMWPMFQLIKTI
ncbi:competence type IV pilus assembly protein ComGB [Oceanobacillus saliphilus]|uniref:competence type IV pilus assembly protein ComGB n=1 Tax=Oceanobacillus saliphilus TaxID=2925834 RepID=UPI00201E5743|nr:competence type IV pilus assembly protein ComGB [Oceanobacillus saliphilus]